jgi:tRNA threonylcarbamoyladenosine biosynthesis protein TsaB
MKTEAMLILGIDTSGRSGGITLAEGDAQSFRALESAPIAGGTFSAQLVPALASLLKKHRLTPKDIGGFAVTSGPGSFTGLRVGLSAVKGLAEVLDTPIATISLLEALATLSDKRGQIAAVLDAGRSEVFWGVYEVSRGQAKKVNEKLLTRPEFLQQLSDGGISAVVTCDESVAQMVAASGCKATAELVNRPGSELIARIGLGKVLRGEIISVEQLDANYIRRSDAELAFTRNK